MTPPATVATSTGSVPRSGYEGSASGSQEELGELANTHRTTIGRLERGQAGCTIAPLERLALCPRPRPRGVDVVLTATTEAVAASAEQINGASQPLEPEQPAADEAAAPTRFAPPSGRLVLRNPGRPPVALSQDLDLKEVMALIRPGGQVTLHKQAGGPVVGALLPTDDPRMNVFEAGVRYGRQTVAAGSSSRVAKNYFQHVEEIHFHAAPPKD
jgi:hypothetical protein